MASVILVFSTNRRDVELADKLRARIEAGGNSVALVGGDFLLEDADLVVVLWTAESVKINPMIVSARQALQRNKLIQIAAPGIAQDDLPAGFGSYTCGSLSGSKEPITEPQLRAGLANTLDSRGPMYAMGAERVPLGGAAVGFIRDGGLTPPLAARPRFSSTSSHPPAQTTPSHRSGHPVAFTLEELIALDNHYFAQSALYASGAGTLTQFNAIVVALNAGMLTQTMPATMKLAVVGALTLHTLAALLLCFALRPVFGNKSPQALLDDTIRNYRRGWTTTIWAVFGSVATLLWFIACQAELMGLLRQVVQRII